MYNGLANPADYSIFAREWTHLPHWHSIGFACMVYGPCGRATVGMGQMSRQTKCKHNAPAPGYAAPSLQAHKKHNTETMQTQHTLFETHASAQWELTENYIGL